MANDLINQLLGLLQGLKTDTVNLNKDLDDKDEREETKGDLSQIFSRFGELESLLSKLDESDVAEMQEDLKKLMSGQEGILDYNRDINNLLTKVKQRTEQHEPTKDKVIEHMPPEAKETHSDDVGSMINSWGSVLNNVQHWIEQNASGKIESR